MSGRLRPGKDERLGTKLAQAVLDRRAAEADEIARKILAREQKR